MSASVSVSDSNEPGVGVWLIGARGSVATTVVAGCAAVTAGLRPPTRLVTETSVFTQSALPPLASLVFGGHDTVDCPLPKRAETLAASGVLPPGLPIAVSAELAAADREIRPGGPLAGDTRDADELIAAFAADIQAFVRRRGLERAVVVNVASTEPAPTGPEPPPSSLYAAAALRAGCPYVETGARYVLDPRRKHGPSLLDPDPDARARRVDLLLRAVQVAADLGGHAVHCFSGTVPPGSDPATAWQRLAASLAPVLDAATTAGIPLAVEPEPGHLLATLADFHHLRRLLGHPTALGLTLDIGHCQCLEPLPPADCVRASAPWLRHVQIEDMRRGVHDHLPFGQGEIDFPSVLAARASSGYRGLTVVELPRHSHAGPRHAETSLPFLRRAAATGIRAAAPEGSTP
ncbi:TIM barrel protein [Streptomyces sp. NPDC005728]|uniref:TIM barrel protein n=1 Tax=Streptomyces sp. NPDC005728 TaxID=3157054 RepID=UPI0033CB1B00